jgi:hypothetical protein
MICLYGACVVVCGVQVLCPQKDDKLPGDVQVRREKTQPYRCSDAFFGGETALDIHVSEYGA